MKTAPLWLACMALAGPLGCSAGMEDSTGSGVLGSATFATTDAGDDSGDLDSGAEDAGDPPPDDAPQDTSDGEGESDGDSDGGSDGDGDASTSGPPAGSCSTGHEGCECGPHDACKSGLVCEHDLCVPCMDASCAACGNGHCDVVEDCASCEADCGECVPSCGDDDCNGTETCLSCAGDCGFTTCTDAFGDPVCAGDTGYRTCPMVPEGVQLCTCSASGTWVSCQAGCLV